MLYWDRHLAEIIAVHLRIFWPAGVVLANPKRPIIPESPNSLSGLRTVRTVLSGQLWIGYHAALHTLPQVGSMKTPIATAPGLELTPQAIDQLREQLREHHAIYSPVFRRHEQREGAEQYLHGLLLELARKSIEPMGLALEGANAKAVRTMPWFIRAGTWDDDVLLKRPWQEVEAYLGEEEGVVTLDGSDFLKQGRDSVGV